MPGSSTFISDEEYNVVMRMRKEKEHEEYKYLHLLEDILNKGIKIPNRTGIDAITIPHANMSFDMSKGFPLLTTKKMAWKVMKVELEGFIKGITNKKWYQERGCHIWDEWCSPLRVPYGHSEEVKKAMKEEQYLGPIYGAQWRNFDNGGYSCDQLSNIVDTIKKNPTDRRLVCSAWNPKALSEQALPPCHMGFVVNIIDKKLNLSFQMRSCDGPLGLPFNISSYATLLHLLAKETGYEEGTLTAFLNSVHIYENQIDGVKEQLKRCPLPFPNIKTENFKSVFTWEYQHTELINYQSHTKIDFPIAI